MSSEKLKDPLIPIVLLLLLLGAGAAAYYYWIQREREASPPPETFTTPPVGAIGEPPIRHPIEPPGAETAEPLPPLARSDDALRESALGLAGASLERLFHFDSIVRRIVVTVDDLPRKKIAQRYNVAKPVAGEFLVLGKGAGALLDPASYKRYAPYVRLAESVDTKKLAALYVHFYPLFQQEYQNLGARNKYFNDRVIEAIDDLLAAPEIKGPIKLVQPKVMYQYADPALEGLSAGQKIMIRMGPENAARIKAKLRELRHELASAP